MFTDHLNFVCSKLSTRFNAGFKAPLHCRKHRKRQRERHAKTRLPQHKRDLKMAQYELVPVGLNGNAESEILLQMGMMYATGRDCEIDLVAAHKWFNIAAIKGSNRAA